MLGKSQSGHQSTGKSSLLKPGSSLTAQYVPLLIHESSSDRLRIKMERKKCIMFFWCHDHFQIVCLFKHEELLHHFLYFSVWRTFFVLFKRLKQTEAIHSGAVWNPPQKAMTDGQWNMFGMTNTERVQWMRHSFAAIINSFICEKCGQTGTLTGKTAAWVGVGSRC